MCDASRASFVFENESPGQLTFVMIGTERIATYWTKESLTYLSYSNKYRISAQLIIFLGRCTAGTHIGESRILSQVNHLVTEPS